MVFLRPHRSSCNDNPGYDPTLCLSFLELQGAPPCPTVCQSHHLQAGHLDLVILPPCAIALWQGPLWTQVTVHPHSFSHHNLSIKGPALAATVSLQTDVNCKSSPNLKTKLLWTMALSRVSVKSTSTTNDF